MDQSVLTALRRVPGFESIDEGEASAERLGGLTNLNYHVVHGDDAYVLRIAGEGTSEYIDREVESHNARIAAAAGVGAEVVHFDASDGLMLARYIDGIETMTPETFRSVAGAPARAAEVLGRMHRCGETFRFRFELFAMIDEYLGILSKRDVPSIEGYDDVVEEARGVREALDRHPAELAPCHCDPLCENFLDDGERMWLVDWEYSGMNDPIWDLGDVSVEAGFELRHDEEMMRAYCAGEPTPAVFGRMVIYKAMADLLWTLWGLIQHSDGNPAEDFWAYATGRFARCKTLMADPEFARHVAAVGAG